LANKSPKGKNYLKYSGLAFQFIATIIILVYTGRWLDGKVSNETPWFTLLGAVLGVIGSMVYLIVRVGKDK
jgi:F0F1-type ATP synthase assembly protein I